jgi:hypothetical protein
MKDRKDKKMDKTNQKASANNNPLYLRAEIETELRARAYKDKAFEQALQSDPRSVLERDYPQWFPGGKVPEGLTIRIIQEEEDSLNVVLLPKRAGGLAPLSEEDLAGVQGGGALSMLRSAGPDMKGLFEGETKHCGSADCTATEHCATATRAIC